MVINVEIKEEDFKLAKDGLILDYNECSEDKAVAVLSSQLQEIASQLINKTYGRCKCGKVFVRKSVSHKFCRECSR